MRYKEDWENTKRHFEAFWQREDAGRCSLAVSVPRERGPERERPSGFTLTDSYTNPECMHQESETWFSGREYLFESLPARYLNFGTAGHCQYFGCTPRYAEDTIWFDPILEVPDASLLRVDEWGKRRFDRHRGIARRMAELADKRYFVSMPDNCGITDCLAELRGTENLLVDMLENPDFVHEAMAKLTGVWRETEEEFYKILRRNNDGGSSHGWMQLWCPGSHVQIQCDFSVMVSPAMFEEFILPELEATAGAFDHTTYHLDGLEQLRHLDMILSVKAIDAIQWTPVDGQPKTSESIGALRKIQKAGKNLVLIPQVDEVEYLMRSLSHKGLHLIVNGVRDRAEAEDLERLARHLAREEA